MAGVFILGQVEAAAIRAAYERARQHVIPWSVLSQYVTDNQESDTVTIADRKPRGTPRRKPEQVALPLGYRLAITFEEQPAGLCAHLSLSTSRPGMLPHPAAIGLVLRVCGIEAAPARMWVEDYLIGKRPSGKAVNVVVVLTESTSDDGNSRVH